MKPSPDNYNPSFPGKLLVRFGQGEFASALEAVQPFESGQTIAHLTGISSGVEKAYTSVQCGRGADDHIELNSDLVYINHSCDPNVAFDLSSKDRSQWRVVARKDISVGQPLTFFYPSTEWDMAQPFACECHTDICLGTIQGAAYIPKTELFKRGHINPWIVSLATEADVLMTSRSDTRTCQSCGAGMAGKDLQCGCKPVSP